MRNEVGLDSGKRMINKQGLVLGHSLWFVFIVEKGNICVGFNVWDWFAFVSTESGICKSIAEREFSAQFREKVLHPSDFFFFFSKATSES